MRQINRKNDKIYYICTYWGSIRIGDLRTHWEVEAYVPFWTKKREVGVWDFKGEAGNSQVDEKEQRCGKQILLGHPESMGH